MAEASKCSLPPRSAAAKPRLLVRTRASPTRHPASLPEISPPWALTLSGGLPCPQRRKVPRKLLRERRTRAGRSRRACRTPAALSIAARGRACPKGPENGLGTGSCADASARSAGAGSCSRCRRPRWEGRRSPPASPGRRVEGRRCGCSAAIPFAETETRLGAKWRAATGGAATSRPQARQGIIQNIERK